MHSWAPIAIQLLTYRDYPVIDCQTMIEFIGRERLFRASDGSFLLHMSSAGNPEAEERILWLTLRDVIAWLNETPDQFGSFWEFAVVASAAQASVQRSSAGSARR
jgi:hypothetical protein